MTSFFRLVILSSWPLWAFAQTPHQMPQAPQMNLDRATLLIGPYKIDVQLAQTPLQREVGLMFRQHMPPNEGMLFVFEQPAVQCFWMMNTSLPLTAAFITEDGVIANLADMQPQTTQPHCSKLPVRFVLEMNQGWFAKKHLKGGARLSGPLFTKSMKSTESSKGSAQP